MKKLIFMDESSFQTKKHGRYVNRKPSCLPKAAGIKERYCQTVHAWLAISENGVVCYKVKYFSKSQKNTFLKKKLFKLFSKNLTKHSYCVILDTVLKPELINKFNSDYLIIQDNDPKHNSNKCYDYMVKNKFKCVILNLD